MAHQPDKQERDISRKTRKLNTREIGRGRWGSYRYCAELEEMSMNIKIKLN